MRQVFRNKNKHSFFVPALVALFFVSITFLTGTNVYAAAAQAGSSGGGTIGPAVNTGEAKGKYHCGLKSPVAENNQAVETSFDIGCKGLGNPITDAAFAIIRFLSIGVGLVIVASLIYAGIQYTTSQGDPKATAEAIGRIRSNVVAFLIFIFAFAILNYLIPKGFLG